MYGSWWAFTLFCYAHSEKVIHTQIKHWVSNRSPYILTDIDIHIHPLISSTFVVGRIGRISYHKCDKCPKRQHLDKVCWD